jgi:hypothetical protein
MIGNIPPFGSIATDRQVRIDGKSIPGAVANGADGSRNKLRNGVRRDWLCWPSRRAPFARIRRHGAHRRVYVRHRLDGAELARRLKKHGFKETDASITNRLKRGTLAALELEGHSDRGTVITRRPQRDLAQDEERRDREMAPKMSDAPAFRALQKIQGPQVL